MHLNLSNYNNHGWCPTCDKLVDLAPSPKMARTLPNSIMHAPYMSLTNWVNDLSSNLQIAFWFFFNKIPLSTSFISCPKMRIALTHNIIYGFFINHAVTCPRNTKTQPPRKNVMRYIQTTFIYKIKDVQRLANIGQPKHIQIHLQTQTKKCSVLPWALAKTNIQKETNREQQATHNIVVEAHNEILINLVMLTERHSQMNTMETYWDLLGSVLILRTPLLKTLERFTHKKHISFPYGNVHFIHKYM